MELHEAILRIPVVQMIRAAGFDRASRGAVDVATAVAARYIELLAERISERSSTSFEGELLAADITDMEYVAEWARGLVAREIVRVAGRENDMEEDEGVALLEEDSTPPENKKLWTDGKLFS